MNPNESQLEWIPAPTRRRLDRCMVRISLVQWQALPLAERQALAELAASEADDADYLASLNAALAGAGAGATRPEG